jgi:hypothetical protein
MAHDWHISDPPIPDNAHNSCFTTTVRHTSHDSDWGQTGDDDNVLCIHLQCIVCTTRNPQEQFLQADDEDEFHALFHVDDSDKTTTDMMNLQEENVRCSACGENVQFSETKPYSAGQRQCGECESNRKRISARCCNKPDLKQWWRSMTKEEKMEWFRKNKQANAGKVGTFQRRAFDLPVYTEEEKEGSHQCDDDVDDWIPFSEYQVIRAAQGYKTETHEALWHKDCADPTKKVRKHSSGAILLHWFRGMRTLTGSHHEQNRATRRQAIVKNTEQLVALEEPAAKKCRTWENSLRICRLRPYLNNDFLNDVGGTYLHDPICFETIHLKQYIWENVLN